VRASGLSRWARTPPYRLFLPPPLSNVGSDFEQPVFFAPLTLPYFASTACRRNLVQAITPWF
jgi:hypothetical protein